jgi:hypothetical protein
MGAYKVRKKKRERGKKKREVKQKAYGKRRKWQ